MSVQPAHHRGYYPQPNRGHHQPRPYYPVQPRPYYPQPQPYFPPQQGYNPYQPYYPNPYNRGIGGAVGDFFTGIKERSSELFQVVLHPFNQWARRPVYHNPYVPYDTAYKMGRWAVNGALAVGAFLGFKAVTGGAGGMSIGG